jgi:photosystem II stability/assembly factor-like uncharacterized protein
MMVTARHFALSAAVVVLLAGAGYAGGAPANSEGFALSGIQINPKNPNIVYASSRLSDTDPRSVLKSTDGGQTWKAADTGLTEPASPTDSEDLRVDALALDPRSPNVLYAGTGLGVFKTIDGAKTWNYASRGIDVGGGLAHRMYEGFIYEIAVDPVHTSTVYAAGRGVWKSTNGGATWKHVLRRYAGISVGIDPRRPEIVYASMIGSAPSAGGKRGAILKSVDGGRTWRATGPSGLRDNYFGHPIVVDGRSPGVVYAGGSTGLFASRNKGRTWSKLLPESSAGHIAAIALDPARAKVLYVGGWGASGGLVKTDDGGQTWSKLGLPAGDVGTIEIASARPQTVYAEDDGLWKSTDGGATWQRLPIPPYR